MSSLLAALLLTLAPTTDLEAALAAQLEPLLARGVPGASAAVLLPDGTLVRVAVGFADADDETPLTPGDLLLSGSIGKTYVAASVLRLAEQGELDLDERALAYLDADAPWVARLAGARTFTLRQLLRHQSGLPRYVYAPEFARDLMSDADRTWTPEERLAYVLDAEPLFPPGEGWAYSDTNYIVLGMVLEALTGRGVEELVQSTLLTPLELRATVPSNRRRIPGLVQGHVVLGRDLGVPERTQVDGELVFNPQFEGCGGGYANTPGDLARWARAYYGGEAFEGDYLADVMDAVPAQALGRGTRYGAAAMLRETPLGPAVGHDGFMPGYLSSMAWFPDFEVAAAVQLDTDDARAVGRPLFLVLVDLVRAATAAGDGPAGD